jgi:3-hydroxymyristoyl/3-hydroxydecanoyl-(acyl carrier protein) dehydratase
MFLPVGQMLQIDRVIVADPERVVCEMDVGDDHWVYPMHFPQDPVFPGCLLIEAAGQAVAIWGWHNGLRGKPRLARVSAELESPVRQGDGLLTLVGRVKRRQHVCLGTVSISAGQRLVARVEMALVIVPNGASHPSGHGSASEPDAFSAPCS